MRDRRDPTDRGRPTDRGYAIALMALLLLPLLAFTGLAVDLGGWYARAAAIQRTADAAALGGVAALPLGPTAAANGALQVAAANGFVDGVDGISVTATKVGADQLQVTISDDQVPQYFTGLFRSGVSIERSALAEYIPPVRMGSPRNFLGTANLSTSVSGVPSSAREFFWLAVNSPCAMGEDGDLLSSWYNAQWSGGFIGCPIPRTPAPGGGIITNPTYSADGYIYGVRVDEGYTGGPITIQVYDAAYCGAGVDFALNGSSSFTTTYTVRAPAPNPYEGAVLHTRTLTGAASGSSGNCSTGASGYRGRWRDLHTISSPTPGDTYAVQVQATAPVTNQRGSVNQFSLRVRRGATFQACSSDPFDTQVAPDANCPNVFALENMSVFANSPGEAAEFFLASIGPEHSGKTLVIDLFDPGEGGDELRLVDPNGDVVSFQRRIIPRYPGEIAPAGGFGPVSESVVNISASGPQPGPNRLSAARYNDRQLQLVVELPPDIAVAYGGRTWWRVRYDFEGSNVTDRTTWSVSVRGDPVRLVE